MTLNQTDIPTFADTDKREAVFHNFDEEKEVIGKLIAIEQGTFGDQYKIDTIKGEVVVGTYDVLKSKLSHNDIGKFVRIRFLGFQPSKKNPRQKYKDFEVSVK